MQRTSVLIRVFLIFCALTQSLSVFAAAPEPAALAAFDSYIRTIESRLNAQHNPRRSILAMTGNQAQQLARLRSGELIVEQLTPDNQQAYPGAMLHHWRGTAFAPGARAADFERLMKDFPSYSRYYAPQVLQAKILTERGDAIDASMRLVQRHGLTVVMDAAYHVTFVRMDSGRGYSSSQSTHIAEIDSPGTASEHALDPAHQHGFLWRMNTYWSYEERDGGLYLQIESVTLTRSIPEGLGWALRPFVESVPRESLEFTLRATCNALPRR